MVISLDREQHNQDWTKQSWDLPPYKSKEFMEAFPDLNAFRKLPIYKMAVRKGLIKNDRWVGRKR